MKVEVSMGTEEDKFYANGWWATSPQFVVYALHAQLEAAQSIWPELKEYSLAKSDGLTRSDRAPFAQEPDGREQESENGEETETRDH